MVKVFTSRVIPSLNRLEKIAEMHNSEEVYDTKHLESKPPQMIVLENMSFCYNSDKKIFESVHLKFDRNNKYALVGESGVGKSTLINLMLRLWDPTEGNIRINGTNIRDIDVCGLREQISIVSQEVFFFNDTIRENIDIDNKCTDSELFHMLKKKWVC